MLGRLKSKRDIVIAYISLAEILLSTWFCLIETMRPRDRTLYYTEFDFAEVWTMARNLRTAAAGIC